MNLSPDLERWRHEGVPSRPGAWVLAAYGYVPNVVYTCGALVHKGELIIPYGLADHATSFATVPLDEVLAAMR